MITSPPEHVTIRYELAGIGSRGVAVIVDTLLQLLLFAAPCYGCSLLWKIFPSELEHSFLIGLLILSFFIILWAYFVIFETLWQGETPGKRLLGLRVMKDAGYPVDFRAVVMRNFLRAIDWLPVLDAFGFIVQLCSGQYKRLGDYPAGTLRRAPWACGRRKNKLFRRRGCGLSSARCHRTEPDHPLESRGISDRTAFPGAPERSPGAVARGSSPTGWPTH